MKNTLTISCYNSTEKVNYSQTFNMPDVEEALLRISKDTNFDLKTLECVLTLENYGVSFSPSYLVSNIQMPDKTYKIININEL